MFADARTPAQGAIGSDVAGVRNATSGSITDKLTREHRMTLDEAHLILNVKRGEEMEKILSVSRLALPSLFLYWNLNSPRIMNTYSKPTLHHHLHPRALLRLVAGRRLFLQIRIISSQK